MSDHLNHLTTRITREIKSHATLPMRSDAADRVAERTFAARWPEEDDDQIRTPTEVP